MIKLNVLDLNDQLIEASLDATSFFVSLGWNEAAQQYSIGLQNADGVNLVQGVTVVPNYGLFWRLRRQYMPLGDFVAAKPLDGPITRNSFINGEAELIYLEEADLISIGALERYGQI